MKILEVCLFSAGADGVWQRVKPESEFLSKKHEVLIFSSNLTKGSKKIAPKEETLKGGKLIKIMRFPALKPGEGKLKFLSGGESFMFFNFEKEALKFKPDLIIAHVYRHLHTLEALNIARKLNKQGLNTRVFLVTHAPFGRESSRSKISNLVVKLYDSILGRLTINSFDKVIRITNWEVPYLEKLGVKKEKIVYIPNGISEDFFKKISKNPRIKKQELIYTGRISPIKNLETLLFALQILNKDKKISLKILGPAEEDYLKVLKKIIKDSSLEKQVKLENKTFDRKEHIKNLASSEIFILPSLTEGHPQSLIEAMARGKIVVASNNLAAKEIIVSAENGFLFQVQNPESLAEVIKKILNLNNETKNKISQNAIKTAKSFEWKNLINQLGKEVK